MKFIFFSQLVFGIICSSILSCQKNSNTTSSNESQVIETKIKDMVAFNTTCPVDKFLFPIKKRAIDVDDLDTLRKLIVDELWSKW
jgi:hypothetical protein